MKIAIEKNGYSYHIYDDFFRIRNLEQETIFRASRVEPIGNKWYADMSKIKGPVLGPFEFRYQAIEAEIKWIEDNEICRKNM